MDNGGKYHARAEDLVVQELGNELLIYDRRVDVAHCLTETAASVWRTCEDGATLDELTKAVRAQSATELDSLKDAEAKVVRALTELEEKGLLREEAGPGEVSRRQALRRIAGVGAGAVLAPLVVSAAVPKSAEAFGSPSTCGYMGGPAKTNVCTAAACGTDVANTCCGAGQPTSNPTHECPAAIGTGVGGCYCGTDLQCRNCAGSTKQVDGHCSDGTCGKHTGTAVPNCCCCSGFCSATVDNQCA
jgi:hypothetical protein